MPTLTIHESVLYALACLFLLRTGYLLLRSKANPTPTTHHYHTPTGIRYRNDGEGNVNAGGNVTIKKRERTKPCEREMFYFAQAKDLQKSVDRLMDKNDRLMDKIERQEELMQGLLNENGTLKDERRLFPVLELKPRKEEEKKEKLNENEEAA